MGDEDVQHAAHEIDRPSRSQLNWGDEVEVANCPLPGLALPPRQQGQAESSEGNEDAQVKEEGVDGTPEQVGMARVHGVGARRGDVEPPVSPADGGSQRATPGMEVVEDGEDLILAACDAGYWVEYNC